MTPALGPTEQAILAVLAASDGLTAAEVAQRLRRTARGLQRSVGSLAAKGCITVLTYRRGIGTASKVWGATSTGRAALAVHQPEGAQS